MLIEKAIREAQAMDEFLLEEKREIARGGGNWYQWAEIKFDYTDPEDGIGYMSSHWPERPDGVVFYCGCPVPAYYTEPGDCEATVRQMYESRRDGGIRRQLRIKAIGARKARSIGF